MLGSGIVTRRPLVLQLIHVPRSTADQIPSPTQDTDDEQKDDFYDTEGIN